MLNSRILGLIWRGTAYFLVNDTNIFLTGEWRQRSKCGLPNAGDPFFGAKLKAWWHKTLKCSSLIRVCHIINRFFWMPSLAWNVTQLQWFFRHKADWHTNLPPFQGARPDHVRDESSSRCLPRELWSFVRLRASWRFDQLHVRRSPPIRERIWVWRFNKILKQAAFY